MTRKWEGRGEKCLGDHRPFVCSNWLYPNVKQTFSRQEAVLKLGTRLSRNLGPYLCTEIGRWGTILLNDKFQRDGSQVLENNVPGL